MCRSRFPEPSGAVSGVGDVSTFFSFPPAFPVRPPPPTGLSDLCSHRRKNKTRVTLSGHHRDRGTWSTRRCPYLAPIKDTYLLLVPGKRESLFHPSGPRLPSCRDCAPHVVSRTSCKLATDIMNVPLARDPLFYKHRSHVNCFGGNKDGYC